MGTVTFDPATLGKAFIELTQATGNQPWLPGTAEAADFLETCGANAYNINALSGLKAKVANTAEPLNAFLEANGFAPMFREIDPGGMGACAILKMAVKWAAMAARTTLTAGGVQYHAFELPWEGVEVFDLSFSHEPLVKLDTKDGGALWLVMNDRPAHPVDLIRVAGTAMAGRRSADMAMVSSVVVPAVSIDAQADLSWLLGMQTKHRPPHIIDQAFQAIKVGVDWEGATVETATGLATTRGLVQPRPLVIDRPFAMWFTQKANLFPVATCYVDTDSWRMAA